MRITLAGVRGTTSTADAEHAEFGGESTCFLVQGQAGETIVVDAGTGLRVVEPVLRETCRDRRLLLLMTHYHLDHLAGLPPFPPLYSPSWSFEIAAPAIGGRTPDAVIARLFEKPFWPVQLTAAKAAIRFTTLPESGAPVTRGGLVCRWCPVHHPEGCVAYRVDEPATGRSLVIATDLEWEASSPEEKQAFERFCGEPDPPDLIIWDGQFTPQNYNRFRGWGHSRWTDGVDVAQRCAVRRLIVSHHAPNRNDNALRAVEKDLRAALPHAAMARQGQVISLEA